VSAQVGRAIAQTSSRFELVSAQVGRAIAQAASRFEPVSAQVGRAVAQAGSRWLHTAAARVRARIWASGICGGQSGAGAGFLRVLRFSLPIFIPPNSPASQSPGARTRGELVADVPSGPIWTLLPIMRIKKKRDGQEMSLWKRNLDTCLQNLVILSQLNCVLAST
jgi:hypothetical protein